MPVGRVHTSSHFQLFTSNRCAELGASSYINAGSIIKKNCYGPSLPSDPNGCQDTLTQLLRSETEMPENFAHTQLSFVQQILITQLGN